MDDDAQLEQEISRVIGTAVESALLQRAVELITRLRIKVEEQAAGLRTARQMVKDLRERLR
jgi:hypothetical protein